MAVGDTVEQRGPSVTTSAPLAARAHTAEIRIVHLDPAGADFEAGDDDLLASRAWTAARTDGPPRGSSAHFSLTRRARAGTLPPCASS